uniref:Uncharacterized protein n=1 Tax=Glossina austeni TaxID=7395 RepID=A0A1A9V331_GLOAU
MLWTMPCTIAFPKSIFSVKAFNIRGVIDFEALKSGQTVNGDLYCEQVDRPSHARCMYSAEALNINNNNNNHNHLEHHYYHSRHRQHQRKKGDHHNNWNANKSGNNNNNNNNK